MCDSVVPVYLAPWTACPLVVVGGGAWGELSRDILPPPRPGYLHPRWASCPGRFILSPAHTGKILLCDVYYYLQPFNNYMQFLSYKYVNWRWLLQTFSWVTYWQRMGGGGGRGGTSCPGRFILPPAQNFKKNGQPAMFITSSTSEIFSWKRYKLYFSQSEMLTSNVQLGYLLARGGGKLSRAVYLAPRPEFQREWIIRKFYYTIFYRNI